MLLAVWVCPISMGAEQPARHLTLNVDAPPGAIGRQQLLRGGPLRGYSQPVEIRAPRGALVSPVQSGEFTTPYATPVSFGLQIGNAYRFRIQAIPNLPDVSLYPSIELIDRTYPPEGKKWEYPIPVEVTWDELRMAAAGKMVTRVVYIEDPDSALPVSESAGSEQRYFEVHPGEDPLQVAQGLGRPVAIFRLGARGPEDDTPNTAFAFGSPPVECMPPGAMPAHDGVVSMTAPSQVSPVAAAETLATSPPAVRRAAARTNGLERASEITRFRENLPIRMRRVTFYDQILTDKDESLRGSRPARSRPQASTMEIR